MSELLYVEIAKECPKCHKMTLFLKSRPKKINTHHYETILGVRCANNKVTEAGQLVPCGYEADLVRVIKDE